MSLWYDKKGKTYASKGGSSWIKHYAEHLFKTLSARLEDHLAGGEGRHKIEDIIFDENFTLYELLDNKVDKISGMGLSEQSFTDSEKRKLSGIAAGATAVGLPLTPVGSEAFNDSTNQTNIPYAHLEGQGNSFQLRTFLITDYSPNTVTLTSTQGIQKGMSWFVFPYKGSEEQRCSGTITKVEGNVVTLEGNTEENKDTELNVTFTPAQTPSLYGTFFVNGGSIGSHIVSDLDGNFSLHLEGNHTAGTLDAHAEGTLTHAYGWSSHAEGRSCTTTGECAHAEGVGTKAFGISSHAEGGGALAGGHYSHAEGGNTEATGKCSHTEGNFTVASGKNAHAEGDQSVATAKNAHAEGNLCEATNTNAHAEGCSTIASGAQSHSEGLSTQSTGLCSHAEGEGSVATNSYAHAEGYYTQATGIYSHAEGQNTEATSEHAHAEGYYAKATNKRAHAEGAHTTASGMNSHAEGGSTFAAGLSSHAEGEGSIARARYSHAEGLSTIAGSPQQHVEGKYNQEDSSSTFAHIVGNGSDENHRSNAYTLDWNGNGKFAGDVYAKNKILATKQYVDEFILDSGGGDMHRNIYDTNRNGIVDNAEKLGGYEPSHFATQSDMDRKPIDKGTGFASAIIWNPEGASLGSTYQPVATNTGSFAAGLENKSRGYASTALGTCCTADGRASFVSGEANEAPGNCAAALGVLLYAKNYQVAVGRYNRTTDAPTGINDVSGSAFLVGTGTDFATSNAFRVSYDGHCYGQNAFAASGADYAEYFEWEDQNPQGEDRRGCFVTLSGNKIRKATPKDEYILGVISATPVVKGNIYSEHWQGTYLTDVFGERLTERVEVPETTDPKTGEVIPAHTETRFLMNPNFDPKKPYLGRDQRPEWAPVGLMGQLVVKDDGTCTENGYCSVADGGIATASETPTPYRVLERLDETHIRILLK